jgi:hypothetical protein
MFELLPTPAVAEWTEVRSRPAKLHTFCGFPPFFVIITAKDAK